MPSAEASLFSILNSGSVSAIVGARIYPDILPQNVIYPAIRTQRISTPRSQYRTLDGKAGYASPRFQIDCYGLQKSQVLALADAVYRRLEGFTGSAAGLRVDFISTEDEASDVETDVGPNGATLYRQRLDVFIAHPE